MAVLVDLGDESDPPQDFHHGKPIWRAEPESRPPRLPTPPPESRREHSKGNPNWNSVTEALGCYPIIVTVAASLDLNSLDSLSRTCRQVRAGLLQYRSALIKFSLRYVNDALPVDPDQTMRYRARAGNWFYMEDISRTNYNGKPGSCARDLVGECHKCAEVVCRNCAIKPPAQAVLRDRHRRLCRTCTKAPITDLVQPPLDPATPLASSLMQSKICRCEDGVWLCQTCGRSIRSADQEYKGLWRWRGLYGEVLGGVGMGIGEGDRGVQCGREEDCLGAKECEHETDCDAADAAADNYFFAQQQQHDQQQVAGLGTLLQHVTPSITWTAPGGSGAPSSSSVGTPDSAFGGASRRHTPSPGYARHEIEGIGGVVKTKLVRMVKVGAGVPEWEDEKARGDILGREVAGRARSWCGWCCRVIPGQKDVERDRLRQEQSVAEAQQWRAEQGHGNKARHRDEAFAASGSSPASPTFSSSVAIRSRQTSR